MSYRSSNQRFIAGVYFLNDGFLVTATIIAIFIIIIEDITLMVPVRRLSRDDVTIRAPGKRFALDGSFLFRIQYTDIVGQSGKRPSFAMSFGQFLHVGFILGIASQKEDCRFGKSPLQTGAVLILAPDMP
ncbi:MAG: hypothetical protein PHY29_08790 [Syntrophales bacterium]|nr:hypothetical protein [Syntrophales bacterium]